MARFMVKASEFKNVCKAVNDRKLAELKKEIIEILKKQDEKDVKKAIDYFNSQEEHYTHLEKSLISGKWIQKAGYGVGTVRIWKGKKYKKIAPGKWARVFEKEGCGTNIAIGKLIAKVQKIDNVEDLMAFVMQNKQRFVDENGIDLPVLDKLRAAVDAKNNGGMESKTTSKPAEKKEESKNPIDKRIQQEIEYKKYDEMNLDQLNAEIKELTLKQTGRVKEGSDEEKIVNGVKKYVLNLKKQKEDSKSAEKNSLSDKDKKMMKDFDLSESDYLYLKDKVFNELNPDKDGIKTGVSIQGLAGELYEKDNRFKKLVDKIEAQRPGSARFYGDFMYNLKNNENQVESEKPAEKEESKTYWIQDSRGNRLTNEDAKSRIIDNNMQIFKLNGSNEPRKDMKIRELKNENEYLMDRLNTEDKAEVEIPDYASKLNSDESRKLTEELERLQEGGESEAEKTQNRSDAMKGNKNAEKDGINNESVIDSVNKVVSFDELQPIATNKSVGENEVQLPYSKDLTDEIESLKNCTATKYDPRETFKHIFYKDGKLITTDARRMKFVEVGELEGIPDGSYVDINTDKSGINIKKIDFNAQFPNYSKVVPDNLNQTATLDTKLVKDKIKEMQKDGAISKKGSNIVQLEFRDGKVFIDDTPVGEAKDIKMKYSDDWGPARNDTNYMAINADYFVNALSGKKSVLQIGERADKAIAINTGSSSNILMPMSGSDRKMDYGQGRQAKKDANEKKSALKEAYKKTNEEYIASIKANYGERFKRLAQSAADNLTERMSDMSDETLKLNYDRLKFNLDKVMDKKEYITEDTKVDNKLKLGLRDAILYQTTAKEHPEVIERFEEELEKRGIAVKKSLFDDFVMDMFIDEDEEEIEEDEENESLFNDYSAEQPELFNSTEMKVQEAFNRCGCCL